MFYILAKAQRPFEMIIRIDDMGRDIGHLPRLPDLFKDARNHRHGLRLISELDDCSLSTVRQQAVLGKSYDCARSEEHTSELQSLMRISYADYCLKKKKNITQPSILLIHNINK